MTVTQRVITLITVAAGVALSTAGVPALATTAGTQVVGSPVYDNAWAGYQDGGGRWFRFVSTTVTIPSRVIPAGNGNGGASVRLDAAGGLPSAAITVAPGGGRGSVSWAASGEGSGRFALSPQAGDQLAISLYYNQAKGTDSFTVTDLTQHVTQTAGAGVGAVVYDSAQLAVRVAGKVTPPQADTLLWQLTGSHLTTYTGTRGTITGPWQTSEVIATTDATAAGKLKASPSYLWNSDQNFGVWLRAFPPLTAYVTGGGNTGVVTPISLATSTVLNPIPVGSNPAAIALTPDGRTLYVVNQGSGTVTAIDTVTNTVLSTINVGSSEGLPAVIAVAPDGTTAYIGLAGRVVPIDTATNTALKPIPVPTSYDFSMAITPNSKTLYYVSSEAGMVIPIDTATNTALTPIRLLNPGGIVFTPNSQTAYITTGNETVTPINTATDTPRTPIAAQDDGVIVMTPDGKTIYVADYDGGALTPINVASNTALAPISVGKTPSVIVITPNSMTAYAVNLNASTVTPVNVATNTALAPIPVGSYPGAAAVAPNSKIAYVTTPFALTPINVATNTALTPIPIDAGAYAIAIAP